MQVTGPSHLGEGLCRWSAGHQLVTEARWTSAKRHFQTYGAPDGTNRAGGLHVMARGQIKKDNATGRYYFVVDGPPKRDGRRNQVKRRGFRTKKEAEATLQKVLAEISEGLHQSRDRAITLHEYVHGVWAASKQPDVRATTWDSYISNLRLHVLGRLGERKLAKITTSDIDTLFQDLRTDGRRNAGGGGLSDRSRRYVFGVLSQVFRHAKDKGYLLSNPMDRADRPKAATAKRPWWTPTELAVFLNAVKEERLLPLWLFFAASGARRGEALGLNWEDIDVDSGLVCISRSLTVVRGQPRLLAPKSEESTRVVGLDPTTVSALRVWRARQARDRLAWGPAYQTSDAVFTSESGKRLDPNWVTKEFGRARSLLDLAPVRLHDLRHAHASALIAAGEHPKVIQDRLGHADIRTTLNTYGHSSPDLQQRAGERFGEILSAAASE